MDSTALLNQEPDLQSMSPTIIADKIDVPKESQYELLIHWIKKLDNFCHSRSIRAYAWQSTRGVYGAPYYTSMCKNMLNDAKKAGFDTTEPAEEIKRLSETAWRLEVASTIGQMRIALRSKEKMAINSAAIGAAFIGDNALKYGIDVAEMPHYVEYHRKLVFAALQNTLNMFKNDDSNFGKSVASSHLRNWLSMASKLHMDITEIQNECQKLMQSVIPFNPNAN